MTYYKSRYNNSIEDKKINNAPIVSRNIVEHKVIRNSSLDSLDIMLIEIKELWDERFVMHMSPKSLKEFPVELQSIKNKVNKGDYNGAAEIAHASYQWALYQADRCETSPIGFNYFSMFQKFKSLEETIRKKIVPTLSQ